MKITLGRITISEQGWAGHFICAQSCNFRRNTLFEKDDTIIIVSTVGDMRIREENGYVAREIGVNRYYETMAFYAKYEEPYWEADVSRQIDFDSPWAVSDIGRDSDLRANKMHDEVCYEIFKKLKRGDL